MSAHCWGAYSEITNPAMKRRTGKGCTGLITAYHQTFTPLISCSICSRTSSSIICPPVRHRRGSGAAQEPDGVNFFSCTCTTSRLCIHQPVHLCSLLFSCWWSRGCLRFFFVIIYLFTFRPSEEAHRSNPHSDWDQFLLPSHGFSFYVNAFLASCYRANICFVSDCMCCDA